MERIREFLSRTDGEACRWHDLQHVIGVLLRLARLDLPPEGGHLETLAQSTNITSAGTWDELAFLVWAVADECVASPFWVAEWIGPVVSKRLGSDEDRRFGTEGVKPLGYFLSRPSVLNVSQLVVVRVAPRKQNAEDRSPFLSPLRRSRGRDPRPCHNRCPTLTVRTIRPTRAETGLRSAPKTLGQTTVMPVGD